MAHCVCVNNAARFSSNDFVTVILYCVYLYCQCFIAPEFGGCVNYIWCYCHLWPPSPLHPCLPPVSLSSLLNNHINLSSLTPCSRSFFRSYYQTVFILRPVRMVTPSIWSTSYSTGRILPPRMPLETLPCTSVLYTTRYFTEYKSSIAFLRLYRNLMQWSLKLFLKKINLLLFSSTN